MIILETNVVSALMQEPPEASIIAWLDDMPIDSVWTTAVTVFEVHFGIELLTHGRGRRQLEQAFATTLETDLGNRVLAFDPTAARVAAEVVARERRAGRIMEMRDAQIAGIALARKATLATLNTRHFEHTGVKLVEW